MGSSDAYAGRRLGDHDETVETVHARRRIRAVGFLGSHQELPRYAPSIEPIIISIDDLHCFPSDRHPRQTVRASVYSPTDCAVAPLPLYRSSAQIQDTPCFLAFSSLWGCLLTSPTSEK